MKICQITGKIPQFGNNVSHAVNKSRRRFNVNMLNKKLFSSILGMCSLQLSANGLRTIETKGGLDSYLDQAKKLYGSGEVLRKRYLKAKAKLAK